MARDLLEPKKRKILSFSSLFRDGMQNAKMNISPANALKIVKWQALLGLDYSELGFVNASKFTNDLFAAALKLDLGKMKIAAFGRTRKAREKVNESADLKAIVKLGVPVAVIVCKSRLMDVKESLLSTNDANLLMIYESVSYLKEQGLEVIVDLEHAVDAWYGRGKFGRSFNKILERNVHRTYFESVVRMAIRAGADSLAVCDTNGGAAPEEVACMLEQLTGSYPDMQFGFHGHNDNDLAVANTRAAVLAGANHFQGVENGYGERCGNANLLTVIARLQLKDGYAILPEESMRQLTDYSHLVARSFNRQPRYRDPFFGISAFATYAGMHASSERRSPGAYFQCEPELVGNKPEIGVNRQSGQSNIASMAKKFGYQPSSEELQALMKIFADEIECGAFEICPNSFVIACQKATGKYRPFFKLKRWRVVTGGNHETFSEGSVRLAIGKSQKHEISEAKAVLMPSGSV